MREGPRGKSNKMIHVVTRFWTNDLPPGSDPKTAWASGVVYLKSNKGRGIEPDSERFSNINEDYLEKLKLVLKRNEIKLKMTKKVEDAI